MTNNEEKVDTSEKVETLFGSGIDYTRYENWELTEDYDQASYADRLEYDSINREYGSEEDSGGDDS